MGIILLFKDEDVMDYNQRREENIRMNMEFLQKLGVSQVTHIKDSSFSLT